MVERPKLMGMVPTIMQLTRDRNNKGRILWFGLIVSYATVVYIVHFSWKDLQEEFHCHPDVSEACVAECFEAHFTVPFLGIWYLAGFTFSSIFFVVEFVVSRMIHNRSMMLRRKYLEEEGKGERGEREGGDGEEEEEGRGGGEGDAEDKETEDKEEDEDKDQEDEDEEEEKEEGKEREEKRGDHGDAGQKKFYNPFHEKPVLSLYLVYFLLQMCIQAFFLGALLGIQWPLIQLHTRCSTRLCPGPHVCVLLGTQEKLMTIIILATFSVGTTVFCIFLFFYTIRTYILVGKALSDRNKQGVPC
ncbi:uncharacterized protein [Dipodomys merriami]|uniref:uncharacterized protein n=1 Tax=Dipodomys merriami TaxID=94247 RepID=UPI0038556714